MKKAGVLNASLSRIIASMGHSDKLVVCDCGLPIPRASETVDLALTMNIPRFLETLRVILTELKVENAIIAAEMETASPGIYREFRALMGDIPVMKVPHEEFKNYTRNGGNIAFVRTGEATPYANVILISGVTFC
jgi:D-ribose pyranase